MYRMRITVYKDPHGKTLKGPTAVHFLGDLCSGLGLFGVLGAILAGMESYGTAAIAGGIGLGVVGFGLAVLIFLLCVGKLRFIRYDLRLAVGKLSLLLSDLAPSCVDLFLSRRKLRGNGR